MDRFYQFVEATNQVPIQGFQDIEVVKANWLMDLVSPAIQKKKIEINNQGKFKLSLQGMVQVIPLGAFDRGGLFPFV